MCGVLWACAGVEDKRRVNRDCQSLCCADVKPPGSRKIGDGGNTADVRPLISTPEQTFLGYLGMHGCFFKAIILLTGMYIVLNFHGHCLSAGI